MFHDGSLSRLSAFVSQRCDVCVVDAGPLSEPGASILVDGAMQTLLVVNFPEDNPRCRGRRADEKLTETADVGGCAQ